MKKSAVVEGLLLFGFMLLAGCPGNRAAEIPMEKGSVEPGTTVIRGEKTFKLLGTPLAVGNPLPATGMVDAMTLETVDLSRLKGDVLLLSIVPSIDTKVCEAQTHYLGEEGDKLPATVKRLVLSRDTPFAQKRFAEEAGLTDIRYLSDYKEGAFGRQTGLLIEDLMLLARAVIIVDAGGKVRYLQVVPDIAHLPDMEAAFARAAELAAKRSDRQ
ncbi:peroxiredoxin [Desulfuromonas soudanensis]|uniref:Peroxiredoxin n=2 Tax=Desulfuromonas soudanensis TaxID=1603606 RepID=A0A0M3QGB4_9BACT|nr:peroxiredoxin [Desulfuromonas soudanensis]